MSKAMTWITAGMLTLAAATAVAQDKQGRAPRAAEADSAARLERSIGRLEQSIERLERAISRLEPRTSDRGGGMMGDGGMMGGGMMGGSRPNEQWRAPQSR
jgi:hypothetical protein